MVFTQEQHQSEPMNLVVTGEAQWWLPALQRIVGPSLLTTYKAHSDIELMDAVRSGYANAAVLDDDAEWEVDVMNLLRIIRRFNTTLPVVVVTRKTDRRVLEDALRLAAFSVVVKPLALEEFLRQIQRIMARIEL